MIRSNYYRPIYQWRRPGVEFGGDGKNFHNPRFLNDAFFGKNFHLQGKHFWWLFLVIDQVFRIFPLFSQIFCNLYYIKMSYMTLSSQQKTPFFRPSLFILSRASDNTTSQNILGTDAWAVPPLQILGDAPRSPPLMFMKANRWTKDKELPEEIQNTLFNIKNKIVTWGDIYV